MARARRPRPGTSTFNPDELAQLWDDLAGRRDPGFQWDGSSYGVSRGAAPDRDGLLRHLAPLRSLLTLAPSGFPSHPNLATALMRLDEKHSGLLRTSTRFTERAASLGADQWKVMCKHVYELQKRTPSDLCEPLTALVGLIALRPPDAATEPAPSAAAIVAAPATRAVFGAAEAKALFPDLGHSDSSDEAFVVSSPEEATPTEQEQLPKVHTLPTEDDLVVTQVTCKCDECVLKRKTAAPSKVRLRQKTNDPNFMDALLRRVPSAAIGGQRKETTPRVALKPSKRNSARSAMKPSRPISGALKIVRRKPSLKRKGETYLLDEGGYVAGLSSTHHEDYDARVKGLVVAIEDGRVASTDDAKRWLAQSG